MKVLASSKLFNRQYSRHVASCGDVAAGVAAAGCVAGTSAAAVGVAAAQASAWSLASGLPWVGALCAGKATAAGVAAGAAALGSAVVLVPALFVGGGVVYVVYRNRAKRPLQEGTDVESLAHAFASVAFLPVLARAVTVCKENPSAFEEVSKYLIKEMCAWGYLESYVRDMLHNAMRQSPEDISRQYDRAMDQLASGSTEGIGASPSELPCDVVRKFAEDFRDGFETDLCA